MYQSNRSLANFNWLVLDNPAGRAVLFVAIINDRVVGMQSLIPYVFVQNDKLIHTYKSEDTLVEQSFRGKGVFSKLYKMVHDYAGETLVWGLTDKKEILERVNMPSSERLTISISVKKPSLVSDKKGLHRFVAKTMFYTYLYFKSSFRTKNAKAIYTQKEISPKGYDCEELKTFFEKMTQQHPKILFPRMDFDYLNWRLTDNPSLEAYKIVASYKEDGSIAIVSILGTKGSAAFWESYYALPNISLEEKTGHVVYWKKKIFDSKIKLIHSWLFECNSTVKEVKEIFYEAGFSNVRDGLWIVHNSTNKEIGVHDLYFSPQLGIR